MSVEETIRAAAQQQTPESVDVPQSWAGLLVWSVGRWGVGILFGVAAAFGLVRIYSDMQTLSGRMLDAQIAQTTASVEVVAAIREINAGVTDTRELTLRIQQRLDRAQIAPIRPDGRQ